MNEEAKVALVLAQCVRDGVEVMFGEGARVERVLGEDTSFAIVTSDGRVFVVDVVKTRSKAR